MKYKMLLFFLLIVTSAQAKEVTLLFVRHGETDWNAERKAQGSTDVPLNCKGIEQAKCTADLLAKQYPNLDAIYSSNLSRAYCTAKESAAKFNLPVHVKPDLREICVGVAEGMKSDDIMAQYQKGRDELVQKYPDKRERWKHTVIPGEESIDQIMQRVKRAVFEIVNEVQDHQTVAVFTHQRAIQVFIADIEDIEWQEIKVPNCGVVTIIYQSENQLRPFSFQKSS